MGFEDEGFLCSRDSFSTTLFKLVVDQPICQSSLFPKQNVNIINYVISNSHIGIFLSMCYNLQGSQCHK